MFILCIYIHAVTSEYALMAKNHATIITPTHQTKATHISLPSGSQLSKERIVSTIGVTGWFSAKTLSAFGIVSVGANAELNKGKKTNGNARKDAPSVVFAISPGMTATHVNASDSVMRIPTTPNHSSTLAPERKPIMNAMEKVPNSAFTL